MSIPVDQARLDSWARFANRVRCQNFAAPIKIARRETQVLQDALLETGIEAATVMQEMRRSGAADPAEMRGLPQVPLHLLSTENTRRLASVLADALEIARRVDEERGQGEDGPFTDYLARLLGNIEEQAFPPVGAGE